MEGVKDSSRILILDYGSQFTQLIAREHGDDLVEVPMRHPARRARYGADRTQERSAQQQYKDARNSRRTHQRQDHDLRRDSRGAAGAGTLVLHVLLVEDKHRVGLALDVLERRQELGEVEPRPLGFLLR